MITVSKEGKGDKWYVDDMITIGVNDKPEQIVSNVVCAFALIFGLEIKLEKLRTFLYQWGNETKYISNPVLVMRTGNWNNETIVDMKQDGEFKYVGINHAAERKLNTQHAALRPKTCNPRLH